MKNKGGEIQQAELSQMKEQLETFHSNLEEFAKKYKKEIISIQVWFLFIMASVKCLPKQGTIQKELPIMKRA